MRRGWMDETKKLVLVYPKVIKQSIVLRTYERRKNEKKVECCEVVGVGSRELTESSLPSHPLFRSTNAVRTCRYLLLNRIDEETIRR